MRRAVCALTIVLACGGALAADVPDQKALPAPEASPVPAEKPSEDNKLELQKPEAETPKADESWWQKILREAPNCKSFTDGCRICSRTVCSNIGIACQPKEWVCNDAKPDAKPDTKPDTKP